MKKYLENLGMTRLILIVVGLTSLLSISIACFILNEIIERYDEEMIKVMASDVYDDIHNELLKAVIVSQTMANDSFLIQNLRNENSTPFDEEKNLLTNYLHTMKNHLHYSAAFIVTDNLKRYWTANGLQKILDVKKNTHDTWYKYFLDKNVDYAFYADTDEANNMAWTIFVNARIKDADGKILGVCGVGVDMSAIQKILELNEKKYGVQISLVNKSGLVQVDTDSDKIRNFYYEKLQYQPSDQSVINKIGGNHGSYVITRYIPTFDWYLVIQRDNNQMKKGAFANIILYLSIASVIALAILLTFLHTSLNRGQKQIEDNATKHGITSHAGLYVSMHLIDLKNNSILELSSSSDLNVFQIEEGGYAKERLISAVKKMTAKESLATMLEFVSFQNLSERMLNKHAVYQEFLSENYGWCKAYFMLVNRNRDGALQQVVFAIEIIDEEKRRENQLLYMSETDAMTGIRNRGSGEKKITELIAEGTEGMFFLMDADKFKSINDNFGHDVGDKVIKTIAKCLKKNFRTSDIVMRLGGDEFAAYAVGVVEEEQAQMIIYRLFKMLEKANIPELKDRKISLSVGAAIFTADSNLSFSDIYKRADSATYQSKKIEGSFCSFYEDLSL